MSAFPGLVSTMVSINPLSGAIASTVYAPVRARHAVLRTTDRFAHRGTMHEQLPEILTKHQLAELLQVPVRTVEGWRHRGVPGTNPHRNALRGINLGHCVRYSKRAVLDYIAHGDHHDPRTNEDGRK